MGRLVRVEEHPDLRARVIALSDESALNAISDAMRPQLLDALNETMADDRWRSVVLTGTGGAFSAGGELSSMPTDAERIRKRMGELHEIVRTIVTGPKPVIAAVDGYAFGSGMSLAASCDWVVASRRASFGCTFLNVGLVPDVGLLWSLPRRVGKQRTRLMVLGAEVLSGVEAAGCGLVDVLTEDEPPMEVALRIASRFKNAAPLAVSAGRALLSDGVEDLESLLSRELDAQIQLLGTSDFAVAREAFLSKRPPPEFEGR